VVKMNLWTFWKRTEYVDWPEYETAFRERAPFFAAAG